MNSRSKNLDLNRYDTDKIANRYLDYYDPVFSYLVEQELTLLEIGIHKGGSLQLWRDYFPQGTIVGIDIKLPKDFRDGERIFLFKGSQGDENFLSQTAIRIAPDGFNIIIDDASHIGELTKISFWHLFDHHLKPGGYYVIEDWGTGYWSNWPDGRKYKTRKPLASSLWIPFLSRITHARKIPMKIPFPSHSYGMVGFIKELIDEQGYPDLSRGCIEGVRERTSKFESLMITPSIVFIKKATN